MSKTNPTPRYGNMHRSDRHHGAEALSCGALHTNAERAEEQVMTRRTEAINTIESDGRYDFAARVMTRRTEAINNIESEGRYEYAARAEVMTRRTEAINNIESEGRDAERVTVKSAETNTKNTPQEDAARMRRPLVVYGSRGRAGRRAGGCADTSRTSDSSRRPMPKPHTHLLLSKNFLSHPIILF